MHKVGSPHRTIALVVSHPYQTMDFQAYSHRLQNQNPPPEWNRAMNEWLNRHISHIQITLTHGYTEYKHSNLKLLWTMYSKFQQNMSSACTGNFVRSLCFSCCRLANSPTNLYCIFRLQEVSLISAVVWVSFPDWWGFPKVDHPCTLAMAIVLVFYKW